jgi:hypothetical protein
MIEIWPKEGFWYIWASGFVLLGPTDFFKIFSVDDWRYVDIINGKKFLMISDIDLDKTF